MKQCIRCKQFQINNQFRKDKRQKDGFEYYCKLCARELHKGYDIKRNKLESRKASLYRATLHREYNFTLEHYQEVLKSQDYKCAICKVDGNTSGRSFSVDHDHTTGQIRGLLCNSCNTGLGQFKDSVVALKAAISYLEVTCHLARS